MTTLSMEIVEQGHISLRSDPRPHHYVLRVLDEEDVAAILQLQNDLIAVMPRKDLYVPISEEELLYLFAGNGEALGLFIDNKMRAACSLLFNVTYENNMARELNFSEEELSRVAQLELSLVDLDLRGHRLQHRMASILAGRVQKRNQTRYLFTTVSPFNYASIQTITSLGLYIAGLKKMYYDWDRYVVYRDYINPVRLDADNAVIVANNAWAEQQQLLSDGYRGFSQFKDNDGIKIMFAKMI
jgi:hypothetical protein